MLCMINQSSLRQQPRASSATIHPGSMADRSDSTECLFLTTTWTFANRAQRPCQTTFADVYLHLRPSEASTSAIAVDRPRHSESRLFSATFVASLWATDMRLQAKQRFQLPQHYKRRLSLGNRSESLWRVASSRGRRSSRAIGNRQQRVAMALARAGLSTSAAEQLAQRLINDDRVATSANKRRRA